MSSCQRLLQIWAHVNVKNRAMQVPQGRSHLHVVLMSGAVYQRSTPDPTGRYAEHGGNNGEGEMQAAAGKNEGVIADATNATDAPDATGDRGERVRRRKIGQTHDETFGGQMNRGGRSGLHPYPRGPTSTGGLWILGQRQPWHPP